MAGKGDGAKAADDRGGVDEDAAFESDLNGGGKAQGEQTTETREIRLRGSFQKFGAMAVVVPEKVDDEKSGDVGSRDAGSDAGAGNAHCWRAKFAVDEDVVADQVDDVGGDQGEGNGAD